MCGLVKNLEETGNLFCVKLMVLFVEAIFVHLASHIPCLGGWMAMDRILLPFPCQADEGSWPCYYLYTSSSSSSNPYFQISNLDSKDEEMMWRFKRSDPPAFSLFFSCCGWWRLLLLFFYRTYCFHLDLTRQIFLPFRVLLSLFSPTPAANHSTSLIYWNERRTGKQTTPTRQPGKQMSLHWLLFCCRSICPITGRLFSTPQSLLLHLDAILILCTASQPSATTQPDGDDNDDDEGIRLGKKWMKDLLATRKKKSKLTCQKMLVIHVNW